MNDTDKYGFSADRPILLENEDLLNRAGFSKDLANAITSWHGKDSLVIALHGDWGAGKSSIKNMALSHLKTLNKRPTIIEFSPWEWAAQEKINSAFFEEISKSIGKKDAGKASQETAKIFRKYGRYLNTGESLLSGVSSSIPTLLLILSITGAGLGIFGSWLDKDWVSTTMLTIIAVYSACMKWGSDLFKSISSNFDEKAKDLEKTLSEIREELKDDLQKRESSILIVMDDLDRLTSNQLKMVFQLIKANSEFPNVVFLLLFQRDIVEEKLTDGKQSGRDYLEKIIQVPFDIPKISKTEIHSLLFNKLNKIFEKNEYANKMFDSNRWGNVFHSGLNAYFDNLRNVYRYISTLSFHFSLLNGRSVFEANPVDVIAIECIRLFEPEVYREISNSKDLFTGSQYGYHRDEKEKYIQKFNSIIDKATPDKKTVITNLVVELFPTIEWFLKNHSYGEGYSDQWLKEMRICHASNFDKYFQFSVPKGELSHSDLQEILSLTSQSEKLSSLILSLKDRGLVKNALTQFESFTNDIPLENSHQYIKALLDIADQLDDEHNGMLMFSTHDNATRLVFWFLKRIEDTDERGNILLECFKKSEGLSIVQYILQNDESRRNKSEPETLLSDTKFSELKNEFVKRLDYLSENSPETLINSTHLLSLLYRWKRWGNESKVSSWLQDKISNIDGCLTLLSKFISKSSSQGIDDYVAKIHKYIKLSNIENFISIQPIIDLLENVDEDAIDDQLKKESLTLFKTAIKNRKDGISEDDM